MSAVKPRQRKLPQQKSQSSGSSSDQQHYEVEDEEQSIIKGLLPCILGIGGVAIAIWLFIYYLYVPPQNGDGLAQCTRVQSVEELFVSLEDVTMWKELGQQLKITQTQLSQIQNNSIGVKEKTKNILRAWFESSGESCWEEVIQSLQNIGMQELAKQLAQDYKQ